jgi:chaperonin cofactor prefoldin
MGAEQQVETIVSKIKELESNKTLLQNRIRELDKKIKAALYSRYG